VSDAWTLLAEELTEQEYQSLMDAVVSRIGPFTTKCPVREDPNTIDETAPVRSAESTDRVPAKLAELRG